MSKRHSMTRQEELEQYAQHRIQQAGFDLAACAAILTIIADEDNGSDQIANHPVAFLAKVIAERARLITNEAEVKAIWAKEQVCK